MKDLSGHLCPIWSPPPAEIVLDREEVHLWRIQLDLPHDFIEKLKDILNDEELTRADRLLDRRKAEDFIAARGRLRQILAKYLELNPKIIEFTYNSSGKPYLQGNGNKGICFNLSHSGRWALLAVTKGLEIGLDLEEIDPAADYEKMAAQFFSPGEKELLARFSKARRRRAFYRIWTKKEASLKCLGHGFTAPKEAVDELSERPLWLSTFPLTKNYIGSLAVEADIELLRKWQFAC